MCFGKSLGQICPFNRHGCPIPDCKYKPKDISTNKKLWEKSVQRLKNLSIEFGFYFEIWPECQFDKILKQDCSKNGFTKPTKFHGVKPHRLQPRSANLGGRSDVFNLLWNNIDNEQCFYVDFRK